MSRQPKRRHISADVTFAIIPTWLLNSETSASSIRLYAVLATFADRETGEGWPSRRTLAKRMHCSIDTIDRATRELVALGAITVTRRYRSDGAPTSSMFVVHVQPAGLALSTGVAAEVRVPTSTDAGGVPAQVRHITRTTELEKPPTPPTSGGELDLAHNGQHTRCRACGTSPRQIAAAEQAERNVKPPWCGDDECDEITRLRVVEIPLSKTGPMVARCPKCHPLERTNR